MKFRLGNSKEIEELRLQLKAQESLLEEASVFISEVEKGNLQAGFSDQLINSRLGNSLLSMQRRLTNIATEEQERSWINTGLAKFSDILRNKEGLSLKELSDLILMHLARYINANQGAIFVLNDDMKEEHFLEMIACYAYNRKKYLDKRIELGEGLAGQCALEKESIYLTEIPQDYLNITSGLGEACPQNIFIAPLLINEKIFGVLELASFERIQPYKIDFINRLSENIASSIKNVKDNEKTIALLNASQQQSEELRAQEEELRQNLEEMQTTQEEMARKNEEIKKAAIESEGILNGINAMMATIEFTPEGVVLNANNNFMETMKCSLQEIKGKHHRQFVPSELVATEEYQNFWSSLAMGQPKSGIFRRVNTAGETIWLNAVYSPIQDVNGNVIRVVKFATDITGQQTMAAENEGILKAINTQMLTAEFTPEGILVMANNNFLNSMQYSLEAITGKHDEHFVAREIKATAGYKNVWKKLASGISEAGIFKRINSKGETVWLNGVYSPVLDAERAVTKVLLFASDVTAGQELMAENQGILNGINSTMATIEFSPDGVVMAANDNFLKTMKCSQEEIQGKHHQLFVPAEIRETDDYQTFWGRLASGISLSGVFERINGQGETIWLNAIYNPIFNANAEVVKILKFATDVTLEKEMVAENKGVLNGINATMATIEFTPQGEILTANENFLKTMKCTLSDIQGKHHQLFVPAEIRQSEYYPVFWQKLAAGKPFTGVFERINMKGETIWLNAVYSPIPNARGEIIKVIKFATELTGQEQKRENERRIQIKELEV